MKQYELEDICEGFPEDLRELTIEEVRHTVDFKFLETEKESFSEEESELEEIKYKVLQEKLPLEEEAEAIVQSHFLVNSLGKTLNEMRCRLSVEFGKLLVVHRERVVANGYTWLKWFGKYFPDCSEKYRQDIELLGRYGHHFERFYFLGKEALIKFMRSMISVALNYDREKMKKAFSDLGYKFREIPESEVQLQEYKNNVQRLINYFYALKNIEEIEEDNEVLIDAVKSGVVFDKKFVSTLSDLDKEQKIQKIEETIIGGESSAKTSTNTVIEKKVHYLDNNLADLKTIISLYRQKKESGEEIELNYSAELLEETINELIWLKDEEG